MTERDIHALRAEALVLLAEATRAANNGEHGEAGDQAAWGSSSSWSSGYQRLNTEPHAPLRVLTRVCRSR